MPTSSRLDLKPLLKDGANRERIVAAAKEIAAEQKEALAAGKAAYDGQQVVRALIAAARRRGTKKAAGTLAEFTTKAGGPMMTVTRQGRSGLVLKVLPRPKAAQS